MTGDNGGLKVDDEEGIVDRKVKEHITNLRRQIDEDERRLYVELPSEREGFNRQSANLYWTTSVRQYLRAIKRLWAGEDDQSGVQNVNTYWQEKHIDSVDLIPPPTQGYDFRPYYNGQLDKRDIIRMYNLPRDAEIPKPDTKDFDGLQSVLETEAIHKTWTMKTSDGASPKDIEVVRFVYETPIPKRILEQAIEMADNFLQQAGVGFATKAEPYMGGDEPGL